ncbi:MAG: hypothetical protein MZV65_02275 [Chromatiales bacterium]|nr:hypothetical protein [Chromatiales bacterium]
MRGEVVAALTAAGLRAEADLAQREDQLQGPRAFGRQGPGDPRHRHAGGRGTHRLGPAPGRNADRGDAARPAGRDPATEAQIPG